MIKRRYFISVKKPRSDGSVSYSYYSMTIAKRSFFPQPKSILDEATEFITGELKNKSGTGLMVIAFNRC